MNTHEAHLLAKLRKIEETARSLAEQINKGAELPAFQALSDLTVDCVEACWLAGIVHRRRFNAATVGRLACTCGIGERSELSHFADCPHA